MNEKSYQSCRQRTVDPIALSYALHTTRAYFAQIGNLAHSGWSSAMMSKAPRSATAPTWRSLIERIGSRHREGSGALPGWAGMLAPRALVGVVLLLAGGVAGLAAGQSMANHAAHRTGA